MKSCLLVLFAGLAMAQSKLPDLVGIVMTEVNPSMTDDWIGSQSAVRDAYRKAGQPFRLLYAPVFATRYLSVTPISDLSQYDAGLPVQKMMGDEAYKKWVAQARKGSSSLTRLVLRANQNLTIQDAPMGTLPMLVLTRTRVAPDRVAEFEARLKDVVIPAYRKAGVKRMVVSRVAYGGAPNEYFTFRSHAGLAEAEKISQVQSQLVPNKPGIILSQERLVYRLNRDVSFVK